MSGEVYVGDYGLPIEYTVTSGLSIAELAAATITMTVTKADGSTVTKAATVSNLVISCMVDTGWHSVPGRYTAQPSIVLAGLHKRLDAAYYTVYP
ncbi:hypothetical protein CCP3SC15_420027 [Gammaproteobacteria bacterium]